MSTRHLCLRNCSPFHQQQWLITTCLHVQVVPLVRILTGRGVKLISLISLGKKTSVVSVAKCTKMAKKPQTLRYTKNRNNSCMLYVSLLDLIQFMTFTEQHVIYSHSFLLHWLHALLTYPKSSWSHTDLLDRNADRIFQLPFHLSCNTHLFCISSCTKSCVMLLLLGLLSFYP